MLTGHFEEGNFDEKIGISEMTEAEMDVLADSGDATAVAAAEAVLSEKILEVDEPPTDSPPPRPLPPPENWYELGVDEQQVITVLCRQLADEASSGTCPTWSILRSLAHMTASDVELCIDLYTKHKQGIHHAHDHMPDATATTNSSAGSSTRGGALWMYDAKPREIQKGKEYDHDRQTSQPQWLAAGSSQEGSSWYAGEWRDPWGAELVTEEIRQHLRQVRKHQLLLSKLGAALSYNAHRYIEAKGWKLTRFLASYPNEFQIDKSGDGRESVTHLLAEDFGDADDKDDDEATYSDNDSWSKKEKEWDWESRQHSGGDWWDRDGRDVDRSTYGYTGSSESRWGPKIYVGNLPNDVTRETLEQVFKEYGQVDDIKVMRGRSRRTDRSCAFIVYNKSEDAEICISAMASGYEMRPGEGSIIVKYADDPEPQSHSSRDWVRRPQVQSRNHIESTQGHFQ